MAALTFTAATLPTDAVCREEIDLLTIKRTREMYHTMVGMLGFYCRSNDV